MSVVERNTTARQSAATKMWSINVRQVVYMALGTALYAAISIVFNIIPLPNAAGGAVALRPGIVIPVFFGVLFGPWVGLFVGGVGNVLGDLIYYHNFYWNWDVGNALIGFVSGLVMLFTFGRYRTTRAIVIAEIAGVVAIIVGMAFAAYNDIWVSKIDVGAAGSEFVAAAGSDLINALILLPIFLIAYNAATARRGRA